ncbi:MAG: branched-chain amino acid ABC transporter ATP-binding protein/permease [Gemmatimonadaceae bacterium]|nr:branched-chain amino acid ABC transporter ATP-binding protein/permease [Acetobacteraceae bacterium]
MPVLLRNGLIVAALLALPFFVTNAYYLHLVIVIAIFSILLLGLDIVFGYTGEVSLGHAALLGIGAYTGAIMAEKLGIGMFPALPMGIIVAAAFGLLLALPALQVTGPYLAMVTLAFGTIIYTLINEMDFLTNGPLGITLSKPLYIDVRQFSEQFPFFDMSIARAREFEFYFVVVVCLLLSLLFVNRLIASRYGRAFEALRDAPIASDCMGVSVYKHKVIAFVMSAGMAGLAGVLFAYSEQYVAPNNFGIELAIQFLLAVTLGGRKSRVGPILGAIVIVVLPNLLADIELFRLIAGGIAAVAVIAGVAGLRSNPENRTQIIIPVALCVGFFVFSLLLERITDYRLSVFGAMILFVVYYLPDGIYGFVRTVIARLRPGLIRAHAVIDAHGDDQHVWSAATPQVAAGRPLLEVKQVVMQFGGLKALDRVDVSVMPGTIHGLIGPNGSGKSTMMNVLTGIYVPTGGDIEFEGASIVGKKSPEIAAAGVARTFQNVQLFGELTLIENVMVGLHHTYEASLAGVALALPAAVREDEAAKVRAASILRFVGLEALANEEARNLPYGKQRLLEIGRALALDPKLLLLDEPAAGLTAPDIKVLVEIIRKIRDHGITLILIEHHMDVVMSLCDTVTVLDFGQKIAEGPPASVQVDERVIAAYLGGTVAEAA